VISASSVGYAAIFVLASVCTRAPITVRKLLATLGCEIVEEKVQWKCGGHYRSFLLRGVC
jgi:hypothetical protein